MNKRIKSITVCVILAAFVLSFQTASAETIIPPIQGEAVKGRIITPKCDKLIYNPYNETGDTLGDFSYAGFYAGKYEIPDSSAFETCITLEPSGDEGADDTQRIQSAINQAHAAAGDSFKVVKLKAGKYYLVSSLGIYLKSGVILAGEGQGPDGTVIVAKASLTGAPINIEGTAVTAISENFNVTDKYVKSGSYEISVEDASSFEVGDLIKIVQPWTQEWTDNLGMNNLESVYGEEMSWMKDGERIVSSDMSMERTVTNVNGNTLTLDMPMYVPLDAAYSIPYIYKTDDSGRQEHIGIENLRLESEYLNEADGSGTHASTGIVFEYAKNCYVRDVSAKHFWFSCVAVRSDSKQISVKNCSYLEPVSPDAGGNRYSFCVGDSQQILFSGCYSYNSRHDYTTTGFSSGPVVFSDCVVDSSNQATENHGYWATGTLYDNILSIGNASKGYMAFTNRGKYGDAAGGSHGWAGVGTVAWNCLFSLIAGNKPPMSYNNFIAGQWGYYGDDEAKANYTANLDYTKGIYRVNFGNGIENGADGNFKTYENSSIAGDCYIEAPDTAVTPRSLFNAQLAQRLTADRRTAKPTAPVITSPRSEELLNTNDLVIEGLKLSIAEKVNIYVDNNKYEAALDNEANTFSLKLSLPDGVHKIYATQTVSGKESTKTADRFITVNESKGNFSYLESNYEYDKIHPSEDEAAVSYDEYLRIANGSVDAPLAVSVYVNGRSLESDVVPVMSNGYIMVPARAVSEKLFAQVEWNEQDNSATIMKNNKTLTLTKDSNIVSSDSASFECEYAPSLVNGRLMVTLELIADGLDADIRWDDKTKTVFIEEKI